MLFQKKAQRRVDTGRRFAKLESMNNTETTRFATGTTYFTRSIGDHNCIFRFEIERRTASSVWINVDGKTTRRKISVYNGVEIFQPFGSYSFAPTISADRPVAV